jgi:hypothetical protein
MKYLSLLLLLAVAPAQTNGPVVREDGMPRLQPVVPAISVPRAITRKGEPGECGGRSCTITKYEDHWTCADGKRVLLNSEDGTEHWCLKLSETPPAGGRTEH